MNKLLYKLKDKKIRLALIIATAVILLLCIVMIIVCCFKKDNTDTPPSDTVAETQVDYLKGHYDPFIDQVQYSFSYENDLECVIPAEGVKTEGFVNTTPAEIKNIDDVYALAENECTIEYNEKYIYYDSSASMWKVIYWNTEKKDDIFTVYIKSDGTTQLTYIG